MRVMEKPWILASPRRTLTAAPGAWSGAARWCRVTERREGTMSGLIDSLKTFLNVLTLKIDKYWARSAGSFLSSRHTLSSSSIVLGGAVGTFARTLGSDLVGEEAAAAPAPDCALGEPAAGVALGRDAAGAVAATDGGSLVDGGGEVAPPAVAPAGPVRERVDTSVMPATAPVLARFAPCCACCFFFAWSSARAFSVWSSLWRAGLLLGSMRRISRRSATAPFRSPSSSLAWARRYKALQFSGSTSSTAEASSLASDHLPILINASARLFLAGAFPGSTSRARVYAPYAFGRSPALSAWLPRSFSSSDTARRFSGESTVSSSFSSSSSSSSSTMGTRTRVASGALAPEGSDSADALSSDRVPASSSLASSSSSSSSSTICTLTLVLGPVRAAASVDGGSSARA
mmetsp:Transcript_10427/g.29810  ORF Transcript_10427/g.29810 Transcript_10427/m.29810 type:complete len:403 (-) Transcript_10427:2793-4001(-)